jgi:hypothetical protein
MVIIAACAESRPASVGWDRTSTQMRPLQCPHSITNVLEDIIRTQKVMRSCSFAVESEGSAAFAFLVCEYLKGKKKTEWWIHPINATKHRDGHFYTLYTPLLRGSYEAFLITLE